MAKTRKYAKLIHKPESNSLDSIPFHEGVSGIERFFSKDFPLHLAIHDVSCTKPNTKQYVQMHTHPTPEVNILLGNLKYRIKLGTEEYLVSAPANIWIPARLEHSSNVIEGNGYFICLILNDKYIANGRAKNEKT